ncbi:MAG: Uma2 family endonuclease [Chloroflexi bacterium]|nr:Uma2 family endonuclease [Chloroflexota bacterium]
MLAPINLDERFEHEIKFPMTQAEFLAWEDEDIHAEWVNGEVIIFMPATARHQLIASFLNVLLGMYVRLLELGQVLAAPYSMRARPDGSVREPDLLFIATEHYGRIQRMFLDGPADLVIEIISPTSTARDRADKFYEYEEAGVPEYLIVDSRPGKGRIDFYTLDEKGSYQPIVADAQGRYHSRVIKGFWFRQEWLFQDEMPDPLTALGEIRGLSSAEIEMLRGLLLRQNPKE